MRVSRSADTTLSVRATAEPLRSALVSDFRLPVRCRCAAEVGVEATVRRRLVGTAERRRRGCRRSRGRGRARRAASRACRRATCRSRRCRDRRSAAPIETKAESVYVVPPASTVTPRLTSLAASSGRSKVTSSCCGQGVGLRGEDRGERVLLGRDHLAAGGRRPASDMVSAFLGFASDTTSTTTPLVGGVGGDHVERRRAVGVAAVGEHEQRARALGADQVEALGDAVVDGRALAELDAVERGLHRRVVGGGLDDRRRCRRRRSTSPMRTSSGADARKVSTALGGRGELVALQHAVARVEHQHGRALDVAGGDHLGGRLDRPAVDLHLDREAASTVAAAGDAVDREDERDDSVDGLDVVDVDLVLGVGGSAMPSASSTRRRRQRPPAARERAGRPHRRRPAGGEDGGVDVHAVVGRGARGSGDAGPWTSGRPGTCRPRPTPAA